MQTKMEVGGSDGDRVTDVDLPSNVWHFFTALSDFRADVAFYVAFLRSDVAVSMECVGLVMPRCGFWSEAPDLDIQSVLTEPNQGTVSGADTVNSAQPSGRFRGYGHQYRC